jgi:hypothetical protein
MVKTTNQIDQTVVCAKKKEHALGSTETTFPQGNGSTYAATHGLQPVAFLQRLAIACYTMHIIETCLYKNFGPISFCWSFRHGKAFSRGKILCLKSHLWAHRTDSSHFKKDISIISPKSFRPMANGTL